MPASRTRLVSSISSVSASRLSNSCRLHQFVHDLIIWCSEGYEIIGVTIPLAISLPTAVTHPGQAAHPQRVQNNSSGSPCCGDRSYPRRSLQPYCWRETTWKVTLSFLGLDNPSYYRLSRPDDPRYYSIQPERGTLSTSITRKRCRCSWTRCDTGSWKCTSTGSVLTCTRLVWPGQFHRVDQAFRFLRPHSPEPGDKPNKVDVRGTVGSRLRRVPGRELPRALVGMERPLPRLGPRLLAAAKRLDRRAGAPPHGQFGPVPGNRKTSMGKRQLRNGPRRFPHWPTSSAITRSTTRRTARGNADGADDSRSWNCGS